MSAGASLVVPPLLAQPLATTARQLPKGSLKLLAYYQGTQGQDVRFSVQGSQTCASPNAVAFACGQGGDVEAEGSGGAGMVKLLYQPWESLQYYVGFGVGDYALSVPSVTVTNSLSGDTPGLTYMAGIKAVILPDTEFTPAVAVDLSLAHSRYKFNRRFPGGTPGQDNRINQALDFWQYQVAVMASHLFTIVEKDRLVAAPLIGGFKMEPYGGVRWTRLEATLKDLTDGSRSGGRQDAATPFLGLRIPIYENEGLFAEASFINGYQYAAGLEIRF